MDSAEEAIRKLKPGFKVEAVYEYGSYWKARLIPPSGKKQFVYFHYSNGWKLTKPNGGLSTLYRLEEFVNSNQVVWIVEGEKCVDALREYVFATTSGGAGTVDVTDWTPLKGRRVRIWPDNDEPGRKYGEEVKGALEAIDCVVEVVDVAKLRLDEKGDCVDWIESRQDEVTESDLLALELEPVKDNRPGLIREKASSIVQRKIEWLCPGRIAYGKICGIAGYPGLGKTQVLISITSIVTTGGEWPCGGGKCRKGKVVLIMAEDDWEDTICPRLSAAGADLDMVDKVIMSRDEDGKISLFSLDKDMAYLEEMLKADPEISLIGIDPVAAYLGNTDSHKASEVTALLTPLADLATRYGVAFIFIHHLNKVKQNADEAMMQISGSNAFVGIARSVFMVFRDENDSENRLFLQAKNNMSKDVGGLSFRLEEKLLTNGITASCVKWGDKLINKDANDVSNRSDQSVVEAEELIWSILKEGPTKVEDVEKEFKKARVSWRTVETAKKNLKVQSLKYTFNGPWYWQLENK